MAQLPTLKNLSSVQKDELLAELWAENQVLRQQLAVLEARLKELEARI
jgi:hypothetical protein